MRLKVMGKVRNLIAGLGLVGLLGCVQETAPKIQTYDTAVCEQDMETPKKSFLADVQPVPKSQLAEKRREFAFAYSCASTDCRYETGMDLNTHITIDDDSLSYKILKDDNKCFDDKVKEKFSRIKEILDYVMQPDSHCRQVTHASDGRGKGEIVDYEPINKLDLSRHSDYRKNMLRDAKALVLGMNPNIDFESRVVEATYQRAIEANKMRSSVNVVRMYLDDAREFAKDANFTGKIAEIDAFEATLK